MNEQLMTLVRFVNDEPHRFMEIEYTTTVEGQGQWEISICLGEQYTCRQPRLVGRTRWLEVHADSYQKALEQAIARVGTVRQLRKATV